MPEHTAPDAPRCAPCPATRHPPPAARHLLCCLAALLLLTPTAGAQQRTLAVKAERAEVGFRKLAPERDDRLFKPGLWAPVFVTLRATPDGNLVLPARQDGTAHGTLRVQGTDSDGSENVYSVPFALGPNERTTVVAYTMPGSTNPDLTFKLVPEGQPDRELRLPSESYSTTQLQDQVFLVLGARVPELREALAEMVGGADADREPRHAGFETDGTRLPDHWFGYDAVDLLVLTTANDEFLAELERRPERSQALAAWVRHGGRLVVSLAARNQDRVSKLLAGWQPALPGLVPPDGQVTLSALPSVPTWVGNLNKPFPVTADKKLQMPRLRPGLGAEVLIHEEKGEAVMVRVPYGLGSVTVLALDLDRAPFAAWLGKVEFWKALVTRLGPRLVQAGGGNVQGFGADWRSGDDVASRLHRELDSFDVPVISFGWVAVFILLYILVVGPLDYLVLKRVFKRLEWTWITFPTVVLLVSVIAYFTAYALKGKDLKVNKIDLVDIDQRSSLDAAGRTRSAHAYGTTWLAILSPRIQSYTVGIEPALGAWGEAGAGRGGADVMITWLGRPDPTGQGSVGRQRVQTLFSRPYTYAEGATGLEGVPIPVWTTKAFTAAWEAPLPRLPLTADLSYQPENPDQMPIGTVKNNLPVDLEDVYVFYGNRAYPQPGPLRGGEKAAPVKLTLEPGRAVDVERWAKLAPQRSPADDEEPAGGRRTFNPAPLVKALLFHDAAGGNNHAFRRLDLSWRLRELQARNEGVRNLILVGRLARARGPAEQLTGGGDPRLPTHLWLGALPGEGVPRPALSGTLTQDTFIRVLLPVRPQ
jgi:hypothetical protein